MGCCVSHINDEELPGATKDYGQNGVAIAERRGALSSALHIFGVCYGVDLGPAALVSARPSSETPFGCQLPLGARPSSPLRLAFFQLLPEGGAGAGASQLAALPGKPVPLSPATGQYTAADLSKWALQELDRQHGNRFELHSLRLNGVTIYLAQAAAGPPGSDREGSRDGVAPAGDDSAYQTCRPLRDLYPSPTITTATPAAATAPAAASAAPPAPALATAGATATVTVVGGSGCEVVEAVVVESPHVWVQLLGNAEGPCPARLRLGAAPLDDPRVTVADLIDAAVALWRSKYRKVLVDGPVTALLAAGYREAERPQHPQLRPASSLSSSEEEGGPPDPEPPPPVPPLPVPPVVLRGGDLVAAVVRSGDVVLLDGITCSGCRLYLEMAPPFVGCLLDEEVRLDTEEAD